MEKFNIYFVSQDINNNYDTYDSMIVSAPDEVTALSIHPGRGWNHQEVNYMYLEWVKPKDTHKLKIERIGTSDIQETKVILASFNAG